jgi:haloalkane dehalogenase
MFAIMQKLRTADERFTGIPEFPYSPKYCGVSDQDGETLRVAWVEDGPVKGNPVLMLHGEPSWSFLYRRMMPILTAAGHRVICPDLVGFGRSDKPIRIEDHTYARHVEWIRAVAFDVLNLQQVTLVGQDWGGLIGFGLPQNIRIASPASSRRTLGCPLAICRCPRSGGASARPSKAHPRSRSGGSSNPAAFVR